MADDFLKKINSKKSSGGDNPFDMIFQAKRSEIKQAEPAEAPKKEEPVEKMEGIENLGKSLTSRENIQNTLSAGASPSMTETETKPSSGSPQPSGGGLEIEAEPGGLSGESSIPARSPERDDIFASPSSGGNFLSNVSSSTNELSFGEEQAAGEKNAMKASKVTELLLKGKKDEAIKFIQENF